MHQKAASTLYYNKVLFKKGTLVFLIKGIGQPNYGRINKTTASKIDTGYK
jgi:hypothetical protein